MLCRRFWLAASILASSLSPTLGVAQQSKPARLLVSAGDAAARRTESAAEDAGNSADRDEHYRQTVVGTWEDDYQGKRTMTLRKDGTGTMVVVLSGAKASLFAARLQFEMEWSVEKGRLRKRTLRGTPAFQVQMILKTMGDRVDEPILELTEDRMLLLDKDGKTKYDWRRVRVPVTRAAQCDRLRGGPQTLATAAASRRIHRRQ
jgi:hypothetical protein